MNIAKKSSEMRYAYGVFGIYVTRKKNTYNQNGNQDEAECSKHCIQHTAQYLLVKPTKQANISPKRNRVQFLLESKGGVSWINTFKSSYVLMATGSIQVLTRIVSFSFVCSFSGTRSRTKSHSNHHNFTSFHHFEFLIVLSHDKNQTYFWFPILFSNCYCRYIWLILLLY